jgi:AraC-like DNA-binding protein
LKHFLIDKNYGTYLSGMGFSMDEVLKKAMLPEDLFARQTPSLTAEEYFRFMGAIDALSPDEQTLIRLAASEGIEAFSPPIFAAYCSRNALVCLKRLAQYKPLIGALLYQVEETETEVSVEILSGNEELELPEILVGIEFVFLVGLIRKATKETITPLSVTAKQPMKNSAYADFIGKAITVGDKNRLVFSKEDALVPFISRNESMWEFFEPELKRRLSMMETDDSCAARVRSALMELLPSGECTIDDVAKKLGYSKRSLQRKLQEEDTNFQKQLNHTRELLARTYLANTDMTTEDIAFLLGYQESGSFLRAFTVWTGQTVNEYRNTVR